MCVWRARVHGFVSDMSVYRNTAGFLICSAPADFVTVVGLSSVRTKFTKVITQ